MENAFVNTIFFPKNVFWIINLIIVSLFRVLCVGGTLVLLLSPQLSCLLKKLLAQRDAETTSNKELKPLPCVQERPSLSSASTRRQTLQIPQGINLPPTQETGPQSGLQHSLSLLKHQATFRVSLGMIDGLIHKYVKIHTWYVLVAVTSFYLYKS